MSEKGCGVCGRRSGRDHGGTEREEYTIAYRSVCEQCGETLARAFDGIIGALREAHGERTERVLDKLAERLEEQGLSAEPLRRRTA